MNESLIFRWWQSGKFTVRRLVLSSNRTRAYDLTYRLWLITNAPEEAKIFIINRVKTDLRRKIDKKNHLRHCRGPRIEGWRFFLGFLSYENETFIPNDRDHTIIIVYRPDDGKTFKSANEHRLHTVK